MKKLIIVISLIFILMVLPVFNQACISGDSLTKLTILHTNDTHASLNDIGRRATAVNKIRNEVGSENVLLVDSGDVFTGSLYFTVAQGLDDLWFMQYMGYKAMSLGNHEFDKGTEVLASFVNQAAFPVLCANFDFSAEKALSGKISPWTIVEKGGERYGIFSVTAEETREISNPGKNIVINDPIQAARQSVEALKKQGINKIIALTHIGWEKDLELARQVKDIDIVVGGHSHTVPEIYPAVIDNSGVTTLVVQAGTQGKYLGQLNAAFDKKGNIMNWDESRLITIDAAIEADPACMAKLAEFRQPIDVMLKTVVGQTSVDLDADKGRVRAQETNLGNLVTDALLSQARPLGATIALINGGAIRSSVPAGNFSLGQVLEILPYGNYLMVVEVSGQQIKAALENGVSQVEQVAGRFPQVAGIRYTWNPQSPPGSRIAAVEVKSGDGYQPIDPSARYKVATTDFLAGGGDGYNSFKEAVNIYGSGQVDYEVLRGYIQDNSPLNPKVEGRILKTGS